MRTVLRDISQADSPARESVWMRAVLRDISQADSPRERGVLAGASAYCKEVLRVSLALSASRTAGIAA